MTTDASIQHYCNGGNFQNITLFKRRQSWNFMLQEPEDFYKDFIVSEENMARFFPIYSQQLRHWVVQ